MLYVDSSALIKHYQKEDGTEALEQRLETERKSSRIVFTSVLTYAEIHAIFGRRRREQLLTTREAENLHDRFNEDWAFEISPVELAVGVLVFVEGIAKEHPLAWRRYDSLGFGPLAARCRKVRSRPIQIRLESRVFLL